MLQKSIPSHVPPQPRPRGRAEGDTVRKKRSPQKKEVSLPCLAAAAESAFEATEPGPPKKRRPDCESSGRQINEPPAMGGTSPTLRRAWPKDGPLAAICVQSVDVQCVLQFTLIHAAGCVLHRRTSRVIHRLKLFLFFFFRFKAVARPAPPTQEACEASWSRPIEKLAKMKRLRIEKQTKKARGRHPSTRPTGLFKPSPTDGRPLQKKGNESFLPPPTQGERESGPPFPSASLAESADGSLTRARREPDIPSKPGTPQSQFFGWRADRKEKTSSRAKL